MVDIMLQLTTKVRGEAIVIPLRPGRNRVGRSLQPQFRAYPGVSRSHAEILVEADHVEIRDLGARNRTRVNGRPIHSHALHLGDEVQMGELRFLLEEEPLRERVRDFLLEEEPLRERVREEREGTVAREEAQDYRALPTQKLRGTRLLEALTRMARSLVRDDFTDPACQRSLERLAVAFRFRSACLFLVNEAGQPELRCAHRGPETPTDPVYCRSIVESVVRQRSPLLVRDTQSVGEPWESARLKGVRSAVAVPMLHEGKVLGAVYLDQDDAGRPFRRQHLKQLQILTDMIAAKLHQCQAHIEMHSAAQIQRHMLCDRPQGPEGYEVAALLQPCRMVGGDFYEISALPGARYLYALGDVSGKGVAAALVMAETLATLRALAKTTSAPLGLMQQLQSQLAERLAPVHFVTLFLGVLDTDSQRFEYVNAGHEPGLVLAPGRAPEWLHSTGPPIGMRVPVALRSASTRIPANGLFGLWSDGLTEAMTTRRRSMEMFTRERLLGCLESIREAPAQEILRRVFQEIDSFTGDLSPQDDRTLLLVKRSA
jgi:serine phosphatase RsbU (regulator of sigma subunit)